MTKTSGLKKRGKLKSHNLILNAKERKISVSEQR
jgi:hypothetical protein